MARPRKPDVLHALHGTRAHDRVNGETRIEHGRPRYPKNLTPEARRVFKELCKELESRRTLTRGDGHLLTLYATIWDRRERAQANLLAQGEICMYTRLDSHGTAHQFEKTNLNVKLVQDSEKQLVAILDRLGLSPLAIGKVKASIPVQPEKVVDPIEEFLAGKFVPGAEAAVMPPPDEMDLN